jgi:23S rRNA (cytosine1962-C5)-methyltransferase
MRDALFAPLPAGRLLHLDEHLAIVDKPAGVSSSSGDSNHGDDMIARLRAHLVASGVPAEGYLHAPVPLERDASGALLIVRQKRHNGPILAQVEKGELAVRFQVAAPALPRRVPAEVQALARRGARALLRVEPSAPRARLARDLCLGPQPDDDRAPAFVHADQIRLRHPADGSALCFEAPPPGVLRFWCEDPSVLPDQATLLADIQAAAARRSHLPAGGLATTFRLVNDGECSVPGVAIDIYGDFAVVHVSSDEGRAALGVIGDTLLSLGILGVYAKFRPRQANTLAETRREDVAPSLPVAGIAAPDPLVVSELGDPFLVRLGDGLSTGIFLDQRANRALVRKLSAGRKVLNLFAYACAFTVSAAAGGATSTVSVDISRASLAWGERNLENAGLANAQKHRFATDEALTFLGRCRVRGERFDLILLDPPSYATTKSTRFSAESDYPELASACMAALLPGGMLLACTNHQGISPARFRRFLDDAAARAHRRISRVQVLPTPIDYPPAPGERPHLKAMLVTLV